MGAGDDAGPSGRGGHTRPTPDRSATKARRGRDPSQERDSGSEQADLCVSVDGDGAAELNHELRFLMSGGRDGRMPIQKRSSDLGWNAVRTHGITPDILRETGVPLDEALETLKNNIDAAKGKEQVRVFFLGANSDAFDMRLMQYTLARHSTNAKRGGDEVWFDMLTDIGVVGTIDTIRVLPSFEIID